MASCNQPSAIRLDKCLYVEDDRIHIELVRNHFFPDWGWHFASTMDEGLRIIQREGNNFDMLFLDMNLPDSYGIQTIEDFRGCTVAPIVVTTGGDTKELQDRSKELGVYGIIEKGKSFTSERIRAVLLNAYREWRDERLVKSVEQLTDQVRSVTTKRLKWLTDHGYVG